MIVDTKYKNNKNVVAISLVNYLLNTKQKPVFLCIGTDKVIADAVGVIAGELLKNKYHIDAYVYGYLDNVIDGNNLVETIEKVKKLHPDSPIIVIDGILGELDEIGQVKFYPHGSIVSGEFNKGIYVGDYSILAVVNAKGVDSLTLLKSVKLSNVIRLANFIADSVFQAYKISFGLI